MTITSADRALTAIAEHMTAAAATADNGESRRNAWAAMDLALRLLAEETGSADHRRRAADAIEGVHQLLARGREQTSTTCAALGVAASAHRA